MRELQLTAWLVVAVAATGLEGFARGQGFYDPCGVNEYEVRREVIYEPREYTSYRVEYDTVCESVPVTTYRPTWETEMRERRYVVRRAVPETSVRREEVVSYKPVTTYQNEVVDQGGWATQTVLRPGAVRRRLTWQQAGYYVDPATGLTYYQRPGLAWTPMQAPAQVQTQQVWQSNPVTVQRPVTQYVPEVSYREVPQTTYRMVDELQVEQVPVQVQKWVAVESTVQQQRVVARRVPVTRTVMTPKVVVQRIPISPCEPVDCCAPTASGSPTPAAGGAAPAIDPNEAIPDNSGLGGAI